MKPHPVSALTWSLFVILGLSTACAGNSSGPETAATADDPTTEDSSAPLATPVANSESAFVEGVAGGVMVQTLEFEAEVVSVDQEAREAVIRGPQGNELTVRVGEDAVNFYQVEAGDRVDVALGRELVVYVDEDETADASTDGTAMQAAGAEEGERPAGAIVGTSKVTATIESMDLEARTATLAFEDGRTETFEVRPDVKMENYEVGQKVVFLITEMLALQVRKI